MRKYSWQCVTSLGILLGTATLGFSQDWMPMAGMTDQFFWLKALWGTDTMIACTATSGGFWTDDAGVTWRPLPLGGRPYSAEVACRQDTVEILICGREYPYLWRSTNMGSSWEPAADSPPDCQFLHLVLDGSERLWAFKEDWLYFSDNFGFDWDSLQAPGAATEVSRIWVSEQNPAILWLVTNCGVFFSEDRGVTWASTAVSGTVDDLQGNPQNPYSAIVALRGDSMRWNHGDGIWEGIPFPLEGGCRSVVVLGNDSARLVAVGGLHAADNIMRSDDAGQTWYLDCGPFLSAAGLRILKLDPIRGRVAIKQGAGALLGDSSWQNIRWLSAGSQIDNCMISMHEVGLIWGSSYLATFVSSNAGQSWMSTPFVSLSYPAAEHTGRTAAYVLRDRRDIFLMTFPSLACEALISPPDIDIFELATSEADTSLLYCLTESLHLYISRDGAHSWEQIPYPAEAYGFCMIHPSSTLPGFAF
ncbi:MAG: hypothetical protein V1784_03585, partial [bacterium]